MTIQIITNEWIDYVLLNDNKIVIRNINNDEGTYYIENNFLQIIWKQWGLEIFEKINDYYYNCKDNFFEIQLESYEWNDIGIFDIKNNIVKRKYCENESGVFKFNKNDLIIDWYNWGEETFYQLNYGKTYKNTHFGSLMRNNLKKQIKMLAIVFPQFHEIPENNTFWGQGFTEWTLLKNIPRIVNNEIIKQPHDDIGYFNLKDYNHRKYMRVLADKFNIFGFCFYHYWFKDKKIMYEPTELMLLDGEPDKPFLFCWANEQWTKRWDGGNNEILILQEYTNLEGNIAHFNYLIPFFKHKNYIKKFNKPVFIFYRIEEKDIDDIKNIISLWNSLAKKEGFEGIHFMRFLGPFNNNVVLEEIDGFVEFAPGYFTQKYYNSLCLSDTNKIFDSYNEEIYLDKNSDIKELVQNKIIETGYIHYEKLDQNEKNIRTTKFFIYDGSELYNKIILDKKIYKEQHRGISVNWNNTPRRNYTSEEYCKYPHYYKNINPELFGNTLLSLLNKINDNPNEEDDFLFISAWNEWNEQAILEPNNEDGYDYLMNLGKKYLEFYNFPKKSKILNISHFGGGTEKYMNDIKNIYYDHEFVNFNLYDSTIDYNLLYENIDLIHINSVIFNNLIYNYTYFFNTFLKNTKKYLTIHDYQWLFPHDPNIIYDTFLLNKPLSSDIESFENLLSLCSKIIFPTKNIYNNYNIHINLSKFKDIIYIVNHCDKIINYNFKVIPKVENIINIAYIGYFINYKGCNILKKISFENKYYKDYKVLYHVFGYICESEIGNNYDNIIFYNSYKDSEIITEMHNKNIHGIMHLSLFEESYCYALTNSINSGIPILYINRGSFSERLGIYEKFVQCTLDNIDNVYLDFLEYILKNQDTNIFYKLNGNIQPNRWYLENYIT